mmetsp:Transcript_101080/g.264086  ORF Transcript_101080/g.264086 Transcript_101080/m.264086 type:complete len:106 (-) Transcript_101080:563-880(-)
MAMTPAATTEIAWTAAGVAEASHRSVMLVRGLRAMPSPRTAAKIGVAVATDGPNRAKAPVQEGDEVLVAAGGTQLEVGEEAEKGVEAGAAMQAGKSTRHGLRTRI